MRAPTIVKQREALKSAYPKSKKWATKVDKWPDNQVAAVYIRLKNQNKL